MRNRGSFSVLRWLSLAFIGFAILLLILDLVRFSRLWADFPSGLSIAGIPVGQLDRQQAAQRLLEVYSRPIEISYGGALIALQPSVVGFEPDLESMLAAAELERIRTPFWQAFWNYLWGRTSPPVEIPLRSSYSEQRLRDYLKSEVAQRYDQPPSPARPLVGTVSFQPGVQGTLLDIDRAVTLIDSALRSNQQRMVSLPLQRTNPDRPTFQNLEILLKQTILDVHGYNGVIGLYLLDLQAGQEINFYYNDKILVSTPPDVAFTASSTIKIPIMVSAFSRLGGNSEADKPMDEQVTQRLDEMISRSNNPASDWIMEKVLDPVRGPLVVTEDMRKLGLENTFLAGFFYQGAPLLQRYRTPANQRSDLPVEQDPYSQTTPVEIGALLQDVYQCAQTGGGSLLAVFPGEITQAECQTMIQYLKQDHTPWLIPAGVPDGTDVAHKHGWVSDAFGIIHDMSDAAIVFTKGGNYVLTIFLYHPVQLVFDLSNQLVVDLSRAVYNYYNLPGQ